MFPVPLQSYDQDGSTLTTSTKNNFLPGPHPGNEKKKLLDFLEGSPGNPIHPRPCPPCGRLRTRPSGKTRNIKMVHGTGRDLWHHPFLKNISASNISFLNVGLHEKPFSLKTWNTKYTNKPKMVSAWINPLRTNIFVPTNDKRETLHWITALYDCLYISTFVQSLSNTHKKACKVNNLKQTNMPTDSQLKYPLETQLAKYQHIYFRYSPFSPTNQWVLLITYIMAE